MTSDGMKKIDFDYRSILNPLILTRESLIAILAITRLIELTLIP